MGAFSGLLGIVVLLGIAFALSTDRKAINYKTVCGAFAIQAIFAMLVLYTDFGQVALGGMSNWVSNAISAGRSGVGFVFGSLADIPKSGFIFAVAVLAIVVFFASLVSVLYYLKIMPLIFNTLGLGLSKLLGTSRAESISATANIFVGQTEAPLVVKPFLNTMTKSELFAVMVGGLASVAGGVLAGYASMGIEIKYLIAASFMAAPGGLLMAKIMMPETEKFKDNIDDTDETEEEKQKREAEKPVNVIDAASRGAGDGLFLVLNIGAMLIAFVGLVTLMDMILGGVTSMFGLSNITLAMILGYLFSPLAYAIGIPWAEATSAATFLGQKIIFNEFVAYLNLTSEVISATGEKVKLISTYTPITQAIITFSLCGFANVGSIGILVGGLGSIAPKQKANIARFAIKAVVAGTLSNLMSATLAGIFLSLR